MERKQRGGVGYIVRKFPVLSETFVLGEMLGLEARGVPLHVFSLERPNDPRFHEDLPRLKARVTYVPDLLDVGKLLRHNARSWRRSRRAYLRALAAVLVRGSVKGLWRLLQAGYIANEAKRLELTHLHAQFANHPTTVASFASALSGIPFSFTAHAMDIFKEQVDLRLLRRKVESARFVVTVSEYNREYLHQVSGEAGRKIVRVYNGIDLERFAPNGTPPDHPFNILAVARLVEKKGLPTLIEACARLRRRGLGFRCWIVGKGRLRSELEALIRRLDLREHVQLLGPHTQLEVLARYHAAHLYVLPAQVGSDGNQDGLPVSIVEALACGLPVISTPVTGIPEAVRDGHNGLLVRSEDPDALATAIEMLILDRNLYARLKQNARASVASRFDARQTAAALHELMEMPR